VRIHITLKVVKADFTVEAADVRNRIHLPNERSGKGLALIASLFFTADEHKRMYEISDEGSTHNQFEAQGQSTSGFVYWPS